MSPVGHRRMLRVVGFFGLLGLLCVTIIASLSIGARTIAFGVVMEALWQFDGDLVEHLVVQDLRLPRTIIGIVVGASLAVSGVLMQAITRNPLADPGLLGVNAGASFAVILAIWLLGISSIVDLVWFSFFGAGSVSILVYMLGSMGRGAATPVRLALAGAALSALLYALINSILLTNQKVLDVFRFWNVGSLLGGDYNILLQLSPFIIIGMLVSLIAASSLNAMALGDDAAKALGTKLMLTRILTLLGVTLLCGASVAIAGPIGFIGLVIPHAARFWCGPDQRWLIFYALLLGPIVLIISDIVGRVILPPGEVQVGIMTALIGGPLFVWIVRKMRMAQL
ncbi:MAG: iron chelate uptake ABC transporter family permease subunit [Alphaproteobacteria bacterium]|nr:iron chelate uptake ABC transporter family permease subunit [Alphaproteobacteria bacterium]